jgi:ZIP family zinc transporter
MLKQVQGDVLGLGQGGPATAASSPLISCILGSAVERAALAHEPTRSLQLPIVSVNWLPLVFGLAATLATIVGGWLALRLGRRIGPLLAVGAGVVAGVALFDLLPEAAELGGWRPSLAAWTAIGAVLAWIAFRLPGRAGAWQAHLGPAALTLHSVVDGTGIGIAFHVDAAAGGLVALAVLAHDLADGANIVTLSLAARGERAAWGWLAANGVAPILGVLLGLAVTLPAHVTAPLLAAFAGLLLFISAAELLPRSHALDPRPRTYLANLSGLLLMLAITAAH